LDLLSRPGKKVSGEIFLFLSRGSDPVDPAGSELSKITILKNGINWDKLG
jgi:hypothetical protein